MPQIETRRETRLPIARAALTPRSYDAEAHTVELVAATGFPVRRYDWSADTYYNEVLTITPEAIDGARIEKGVCPLLNAHSSRRIEDQLGTVTDWRVEREGLILTVRFGGTEAAQAVEAEVAAGNLRGVSVGYGRIEMLKEARTDGVIPTYKVTRWSLSEVSLVPIPADPDAGVRSDEGLHPCSIIETRDSTDTLGAPNSPEEDDTMRNRMLGGAAAIALNAPNDNPGGGGHPAPEQRSEQQNPAPEQQERAPDAHAVRMSTSEAFAFVDDARALGTEVETQARSWAETLPPQQARDNLLRAFADAQRSDAPRQPGQQTVRVLQDERDTHRSAISNAIQHRFNPTVELTDAGRQYRGMTLMEMARANLERNGEKTGGLGKRELADLALRQHSTSDFPNVLSNVTRATLRSGYTEAPQTFKAWQRRASVSDFRQVSRLQMGSAPSFLLVPEGGEFKMGTIGDGKEVYALATYGRKFAITRQTLINDDVDAFTRIPVLFGAAAARFESDAAYAPLIANPNMSDGKALFHVDHGNLASSGAVPSEASLEAAEIAMGKQTGIGGEILNLSPKFLIVARKDALKTRKLLTAVQSTTTAEVNPYAQAFTPIVESRLNRTSGATPWVMAADPNQIDTIEYAYLDGDDGVFLDERVGFDVDGIEYKARLDFAVKAIDFRGLYMDPGQ